MLQRAQRLGQHIVFEVSIVVEKLRTLGRSIDPFRLLDILDEAT
jgi:hypothetical protein